MFLEPILSLGNRVFGEFNNKVGRVPAMWEKYKKCALKGTRKVPISKYQSKSKVYRNFHGVNRLLRPFHTCTKGIF